MHVFVCTFVICPAPAGFDVYRDVEASPFACALLDIRAIDAASLSKVHTVLRTALKISTTWQHIIPSLFRPKHQAIYLLLLSEKCEAKFFSTPSMNVLLVSTAHVGISQERLVLKPLGFAVLPLFAELPADGGGAAGAAGGVFYFNSGHFQARGPDESILAAKPQTVIASAIFLF